ncbi:MAG: hypothetical protein ABIU54_05080 [Candidatus Eisenbacteria bacterium]
MPPVTGRALAVMAAVAALCIVASVTYPIYDPDLWQHLTVGQKIWESHSIPHTQLWSWPTYGAPDVLPSWLYRALLYPFWAVGGVHGLFLWRWLTALGVAAFGYFTARRMGARGLAPFVALVWCAFLFRMRSQARPETLVVLLMAAQLWVLEGQRAAASEGRPHRGIWWLVPIALLWANTHISYYLGLVLTGTYAVEGLISARGGERAARPLELFKVFLASVAVSFANPFGWRALWQPFEYFLYWRHEPIYSTIGELKPVVWKVHMRDGFPVWIALIVGLALARVVGRRGDRVQWVVYVLFLGLALPSQRFVGFLAVAVAPFFARDLAEWCRTWRLPGVLRPAATRTFVTSACLVAAITPELTTRPLNLGYGFLWSMYPVGACDWIEQHGVRGRCASVYEQAGYLLWRFHPDRTRLPFMDIHQSGTREDRLLYAYAWNDSNAWRQLDRKYRFDYVVARRVPRDDIKTLDILDILDADSTWRLVFLDDLSALYLRRQGPMADLAERERFRIFRAGLSERGRLGNMAYSDSVARRGIRAELARQVQESRQNSQALHMLALIDLSEGHWGDAVRKLESAQKVDPEAISVREHLALARDSLRAEQGRE